ncbi:hypothetical protein B6N60_00245 [Richelia sinica FACHB-800]|uniref:Uncharacterized protein n=1 Tax=Richelia sinica FACHB-800 TaxID=1357546 RepID=A0A975Y2Y1_9NOST|nr:hypothetical protein B6N60_00245 [Richelia sinica FACHB-800]
MFNWVELLLVIVEIGVGGAWVVQADRNIVTTRAKVNDNQGRYIV